jgi:protease-4
MSDQFADDIIDRRRLRRKLTFWRVVAVLVAVVGIAVVTAVSMPDENFGPKSRAHVAKVRVEGTILEDEELLDVLQEVAKSEQVKGVIIAIDSPGGTTAGGEAIFEAVRKIAADKPVVAQVGTLAASAGYMIAVATDHIVARQSSIVGSIGVLFQYPNATELLDKIGVDVRTIKSSPLKAEPNFFNEPPPGAEAMIQSMILDSYDWFKGLVEERRPLTKAEVAALADGSIFTGRQALDNKLIDELGGEDAAIGWLIAEGLDKDLKVVEWKKPEPVSNFFLSRTLLELLGLEQLVPISADLISDRLFLDGLVSVWQLEP